MMNTPQQDPKQPQKIGRGMLTVMWVGVLGALVYIFGQWESRQNNPNQTLITTEESGTRQVSLKRNRYGHYVTNGKINGDTVVFMLDTGATQVALPSKVADKLGLTRGPAYQVNTANGITTAYATTIDRLELGGIVLHDVRAAITPGMQGMDILLGMSALKQLDFNQSNNILTLTQVYR